MAQHEIVNLPEEDTTHPPIYGGVAAAAGNLAGQVIKIADSMSEPAICVPSQIGTNQVPDEAAKPRPPHADPVRGIPHFGGGDAHDRATVGAIADFLWGHDGSKHKTANNQ